MNRGTHEQRTAVIVGSSSSIGTYIAERLVSEGWRVVGTARFPNASLGDYPVFRCDLSDASSIQDAANEIVATFDSWDLLLTCAGTMEPIGSLLDSDEEEWSENLQVNALGPLHLLRLLWPNRTRVREPNVAFLAGGGTNGTFSNYSAYCISKILLIKACELLDDEEQLGNFFVLGPGYFKSPIHEQTLQAGLRAGKNLTKTLEFLRGEGTNPAEILQSLFWCMDAGRESVGGRNVSTVHDPWREGGIDLKASLESDPEAFKLRRKGHGASKAGGGVL